MNKIDLIKESLTCGLCLSLLNKPIILPCLTTICGKHVLESKSKKFNCFVCKSEHETPKNGFESNLLARNIIESCFFESLEKNDSEYPVLESKIALYNLINSFEKEIFEFERLRNEKFDEFNDRIETTREQLKLRIDNLMNSIKINFKNCENELVKQVDYINSTFMSLKCDASKINANFGISGNDIEAFCEEIDLIRIDIENNLDKIINIKDEYIEMVSLNSFENLFSDENNNFLKQSQDPFLDNYLIVCSANNEINIWDMAKNERIQTLQDFLSPVNTIYLLSDNRLLTITDDRLKLCDLNETNCLKGLKSYYGGISCSLNLAEDIVLIANQENLEIWDFKRDAFDVVKAHKCQINCLAKLTDNYFVTGSNNGLVKIWDFGLGNAIKIFNQHWPITNILIKPRSN